MRLDHKPGQVMLQRPRPGYFEQARPDLRPPHRGINDEILNPTHTARRFAAHTQITEQMRFHRFAVVGRLADALTRHQKTLIRRQGGTQPILAGGMFGLQRARQAFLAKDDLPAVQVLPDAGLPAVARQHRAQGPDGEGATRPGAFHEQPVGVREVIARHRTEVLLRAALLVVTVLPIVLLSQHMAVLLDDGLGRAGAPVALAGVLIAMIVFLPESITSVRAALQGEIQRVSNLCHGALVSTVGLTIPAVLVIGLLTGQPVVLGETPVNLLLLGVSLLLSVTTFTAQRVTAVHGAVHLALFAVYGLSVFA